jgi:hypothetical protein
VSGTGDITLWDINFTNALILHRKSAEVIGLQGEFLGFCSVRHYLCDTSGKRRDVTLPSTSLTTRIIFNK